jgi:hypothetical protein
VVISKDRIAEENTVDQISVGCMDSNAAVTCRLVLQVYVLLVVAGGSRVVEAAQNESREVVGWWVSGIGDPTVVVQSLVGFLVGVVADGKSQESPAARRRAISGFLS